VWCRDQRLCVLPWTLPNRDAAGKVFAPGSGVQFTPVTVDNFENFSKDLDAKFADLGCDAQMAGGASAADVSSIKSAVLAKLLCWHNGGVVIGEYTFLSCAEIASKSGGADTLTVATDVDGDALTMDAAETLSAGGTLSEFLGKFWLELGANKYEWAEGWVHKG